LDQDLAVPPNPPDLRGYVELALRSGFPEAALRLSDSGRIRWLDSYVDQVLTRDALQLESRRDPDRLRRYLEAYALNSAGVVEEQTLLEAAGINLKTAKAYEQLLTNLLIVEAVPSWTTNRLKRLIMSPKRYVVDAALVAAILRLDLNGVLRDGNILGRILDTFVAAQLRAELGITTTRPRLYHFRTKGGRQEVDLLAELGGQRVVGIEVKADSAPDREGARHLFWLREKLEDRFQAGVLFHTGQRTFTFGERIIAAPIATLWS
jgi:predicted AAA+ superfamily ATPase